MRFLADKNFLRDAVEALRQSGHDVVWICTEAPGSADSVVLQMAQADDRILLTFDLDFGELAVRSGLPSSIGVILFRLKLISSAQVAEIAIAALASRSDWSGHFTVIEADRIRMRPLPNLESAQGEQKL